MGAGTPPPNLGTHWGPVFCQLGPKFSCPLCEVDDVDPPLQMRELRSQGPWWAELVGEHALRVEAARGPCRSYSVWGMGPALEPSVLDGDLLPSLPCE